MKILTYVFTCVLGPTIIGLFCWWLYKEIVIPRITTARVKSMIAWLILVFSLSTLIALPILETVDLIKIESFHYVVIICVVFLIGGADALWANLIPEDKKKFKKIKKA